MPTAKSIEKASKVPRLDELRSEVNQAINDSAWFFNRNLDADNTRYCQWSGQSEDGKKHQEDIGRPAFPWEGASDTRIRTVDEVVNEQVKILKASFFRGNVQTMPVESGDVTESATVAILLSWLFKSDMLPHLRREVELIAQWRQHYGSSINWITWDEEVRWERQQLSLQALQAIAVKTQNQTLLGILDAIFDPTQESQILEVIQGLAPDVTAGEAKQILKDLQTKGAAEIPQKYIFKSRPRWEALRVGVDVFFPANTYDIQRARFVARREWVTETELRNRIATEGYNKDFVEEAAKKKGVSSRADLERKAWTEARTGMSDQRTIEDYRDLIELIHSYYKVEERGANKVQCTVFHAGIKDLYAKHDEDVYDHGFYPCVPFVREWTQPTILDSRGNAELAQTWQQEIKTQRDYRTDRAGISILPPLKYPSNRGKMEILVGPATQIPERRPGEIEWMRPPPFDQGSLEIERAVKSDVAGYFGLISPEMPPQKVDLYQQDLVDDFLIEITVCLQMTFALVEQFMPEEQVARIVGSLSKPWKKSRQEIQDSYDAIVTFDVRDLNTEYVFKKLELVSKMLLPMDTAGVIDRAGLMKDAMSAVDPRWARQYVRDSAAVSQQEVDDEQLQFTKLAAGVEAPMKESGQNFALRLQTLQNILTANPELQQRLIKDPVFKKLVETRAKHFQFMLQQQQNAQTGRIGVQPALGIGAVMQ